MTGKLLSRECLANRHDIDKALLGLSTCFVYLATIATRSLDGRNETKAKGIS